MWKFSAILLVAALCVRAEDELPQRNDPEPASLMETVLCYVSPTPWNCVKEQAGRMLNYLEGEVEEKRHEIMVEADDEMKESEKSRGIDDGEKTDKPSEVMSALDKGLSAIANLLTDEINGLSGRESRAIKHESKDVFDDANDFNDDDFSLIDSLAKQEGKGNLTDEARARKKGDKQGLIEDEFGYGGSYGGYRGKGKKKKGKKGLMKLFFVAAIVKSKVELLLKVLSFHLQLKFFAIAVAGLFINLARFWIDLKKHPQKVVYVEHAQHQHHYDEHDDWGSNWKRQANNNNNQDYQQDNFAHRLAYNSAPYPQQ